MTKRKLVVMLIAGSGFLASCDGDEQATTNGLATSQITRLTCNTNTPSEINNINISENDDQIDVNALTPGCTLPGG